MIYLYRGLYIAGLFTVLKLLSLVINVGVAELAAYTAVVILADNLSLLRLQKVLIAEKARLEKKENE